MNLKEIISDNWEKNKFISISLKEDIRSKLIDETSFLDQHYKKIPLRNRAYVILHDITEQTIPKCKCGCGQPCALNVTNSEKGFREFAGATCSRKSKTIPHDALAKLKDFDWLYDQRIVQQKSVELIAQELEISDAPVRKWIFQHKINDMIDCRSRNNSANLILRNKTELEKLYNTGLTCEEIAEQLYTTKATVSRWLGFHNIQIRSSNSYERKIKRISNEENELLDFIRSIYPGEIQSSNRSVLNGKELDIYLPEFNLAIEYNELYSHCYKPHEKTESLIKGPNYHLSKTVSCEEQGIQLLHVFSDEWKLKGNIVRGMIRNKLGLNEKVYARKCDIIEVGVHEKNTFLNENHIQGEDKSRIKLGLEYDGELVCLMTFTKSRFNSDYDWELSRFCSKLGYNVIGGFSRLLKYFRSQWPGSIVSYADRRYSMGNVYVVNGFKLIRINSPGYYYVDGNYNKRYNRLGFQKKLIGAVGKTEYERARELGFNKIYDCGTLAYGLG
jgi:transposase